VLVVVVVAIGIGIGTAELVTVVYVVVEGGIIVEATPGYEYECNPPAMTGFMP
jgi:hypothetical protein